MMRNGQVFELQMQERHTADTESSSQQQKLPTPTTMDAKATNNPDVIDKFLLQGKQTCLSYELLRSPKASKGQGGALGEQEALRRGNTVGVRDQVMDLVASQGLKVSRVADNLLPTPNTMEHLPARTGEARERQLYRGGSESKRSSSGNLREDILDLIPTPTTRDYKDGQAQHKRDGVVQTDTVARAVFNSGEVTMLPTPQVDDSKNTGHNQDRRVTLASEVWATEKTTNWGKFQPAILRWEQTLGIAAPAPTKPDGKESAHRLSSEFTEWMMGLEPGWITDCGLTRNEELKAAGNGVVPQQAELALRILLGLDIPKALERERERELIPTPTVFHVSMHDEPIETFLTRQAKSSTGQIGKSLGVALRMELDK
jgi:hypothetical protein